MSTAKKDAIELRDFASNREDSIRNDFSTHLRNCPIPGKQILSNLGLFISSKELSRLLFLNHVYQQIVDIHGSVFEFGTRWGQNVAVFSALRGIYEPFNRHRKIVAFDTFTGFPSVSDADGEAELIGVGNLTTTENYIEYLSTVMDYHEQENPLSHIKKYELVQGDGMETVPAYLEENPETIIALAYFDFDLYEPTKVVLEAIKDRLVKGSIVGFDELNDHDAPGETRAVMEVLGLNNIRLERFRHASRTSYFVVE